MPPIKNLNMMLVVERPVYLVDYSPFYYAPMVVTGVRLGQGRFFALGLQIRTLATIVSR